MLLLVVVTITVSERPRPGLFYDVVWARVQGIGDLADWGEAFENRQLAADLAREAAGWPGVGRAGWPDVQGVDGDMARLDTQLATFTVVVDPEDGSVEQLARKAFDQSLVAAEAGVRLDVTLQVDDVRLVVSDTAGRDLDLAVDLVEEIRDDPRFGQASVSLAPYPSAFEDPEAFFSVEARTLQVEDVELAGAELCDRVEASRSARPYCFVSGPRDG